MPAKKSAPSTASNLVRALAAGDLARRHAADRRTVQLHVLPAGVRVLRRAPGPFAGVLPTAWPISTPAR